jgi:hypothetical protein
VIAIIQTTRTRSRYRSMAFVPLRDGGKCHDDGAEDRQEYIANRIGHSDPEHRCPP